MAKRRGNGEGSIRQRANGTWQASVMVGYYPDGRRKTKSFTGKTQAEARKKMNAYLNDRASGLDLDHDYTVSEWCEIFLEHHKRSIKVVTYENYRHMQKHINKHIGDMKIQTLKPMHLEQFTQDLIDEQCSFSAISKTRALLYMCLEAAESNDLIRKNPMRFVSKLRTPPPKKQDCFTEEEMGILMKELPDNRIGDSIRLMLASGIRTQELLALTPKHIAEDGSQIVIEQAVTMVRGTAMVSTPKSHAGYRTIPIPKHVRHCAVSLRETPNDYIWSVGDPHKPANPTTFRKAYREAIEAVPGVPYRAPHSCRRAYVSLLFSKHVPLSTSQQLLGHSSLKMSNHYLTIPSTILEEAAAQFDAAFFPEEKTVESD